MLPHSPLTLVLWLTVSDILFLSFNTIIRHKVVGVKIFLKKSADWWFFLLNAWNCQSQASKEWWGNNYSIFILLSLPVFDNYSILYFYWNDCSFACHLYIYIYIYIYIHGASISFQTLFVHAFKIVVDSWKFSRLLLYILWNDRPIFMISGSNEQLHQQLEYTLLKPDCHSWWISKMQSGCEDTLEERYAIKFCFKLGKNPTKMYGLLQTAFGLSCMNQASVFEWHKRFKEGTESVRDDERCGRSKEVRTPKLIGQRVRVTMLRF